MDSTPGPTGRLRWYGRRLRSMSPAEMVWRGQRWVGHRMPHRDRAEGSAPRLLRDGIDWDLLATRFREASGRPILLDRARAQVIASSHPEKVAGLLAAAERIRDGRVAYFGYPEVQLASPVDWNYDPLRQFSWPLRDSTRIDHRTAAADPKWIWELNRLQHLPLLAEAWLFTGDDGYAELALDHLDSWLDQNPVGRGIAWRGAFEVGIRAISVALALQGLRESPALNQARLERSVTMLATSADLCWRDRSRFSSANNHLVGELAGLATVAMLFPELAGAARWEQRALQALAVEASRQILPDGAGAEQAMGYQIFTAELLLVVAVLLTSRGDPAPPALSAALNRSAGYLSAVVGQLDPDPRYGDDDEGFALRLGPEPHRTVREHLALVAALTGNRGARRAGSTTLSSLWVDAAAQAEPTGDEPAAPQSLHAPDGGLVVLRTGARRLTMDVAPLGYLSIAAHGHADALAVTVSLDGQDVIGDPGAGSYYGHPEWRRAHRSTRAHATATVDGLDQSVSGGPFLWTERARARVRAVDLERGLVDAEHDGYARLPAPVRHRRWLLAPPEQDAVLVLDELSGSGEHELRVSWPLHPRLDVRELDQGYLATRHREPVVSIVLAATAPLLLDRVRGDEGTHLGWWSDRLEARAPSWLLGGVVRGVVPVVVATVIRPSLGGPETTDLAVSEDEDSITASWFSAGQRHAVVIDRGENGAVVSSSFR